MIKRIKLKIQKKTKKMFISLYI